MKITKTDVNYIYFKYYLILHKKYCTKNITIKIIKWAPTQDEAQFLQSMIVLLHPREWHWSGQPGMEPVAGETNIFIYYRSAWLMLYYWLSVRTYQVYIRWIPWFEFCNYIGWQMYINSISLPEMLTYLERLIMQLWLCDKAFSVGYFSDFILKYTYTRVVEIEMVPI